MDLPPNDRSLLTLSIAAATVLPIKLPNIPPNPAPDALTTSTASPITPAGSPKHHRRLSSAGKSRRRLSDARDAASRPLPAALQMTGAAISLASLSLTSTSPSPGLPPHSAPFALSSNSQMPIPSPATHLPDHGTSKSAPIGDGSILSHTMGSARQNGPHENGAKSNKKKGMDHRCESCSKIYRHPSCLIKHRWEHTPHWREASKFVLSKHQQVQLLEAAAILSHLSPSSSTGTCLPEDRSLWPYFLSGGSIPPPPTSDSDPIHATHSSLPSSSYIGHPTSRSAPIRGSTRATSAGPRLHDYPLPASANGSGGITQLRPGLIGVPTGPGVPGHSGGGGGGRVDEAVREGGSLPVPVPVPVRVNAIGGSPYRRGYEFGGGKPDSWGSSSLASFPQGRSSYPSTTAVSYSLSGGGGAKGSRESPLCSLSGSSRSDVGSRSDVDEEEDGDGNGDGNGSEVVVDVELIPDEWGGAQPYGFSSRGRHGRESGKHGYGYSYPYTREEEEMRVGYSVREEDEEDEERGGGAVTGRDTEDEEIWDGMEMEMDMD